MSPKTKHGSKEFVKSYPADMQWLHLRILCRRRESDDTQCFVNSTVCHAHGPVACSTKMVPFQTDMYDMFTLLTPLAGTIEFKGGMRGRE